MLSVFPKMSFYISMRNFYFSFSFVPELIKYDLPNNPNWARRIQDIKEFGYTSIELVLSGPGLVNIYTFLSHYHSVTEKAEYKTIISSPDQAAAVARHFAEHTDNGLACVISVYGGCNRRR